MLEAAVRPVKTIERQLDCIERIIVRQHLEMNRGALMSSETNETDLALLLRLVEKSDAAVDRLVDEPNCLIRRR